MSMSTLGMKVGLLIKFQSTSASMVLPSADETGGHKRGEFGAKLDFADRTKHLFPFVRVAFESVVTIQKVQAHLAKAAELMRHKDAPRILSISVLQAQSFGSDCIEALLDALPQFRGQCKHVLWIVTAEEFGFVSSAIRSECNGLGLTFTSLKSYIDAIDKITELSQPHPLTSV